MPAPDAAALTRVNAPEGAAADSMAAPSWTAGLSDCLTAGRSTATPGAHFTALSAAGLTTRAATPAADCTTAAVVTALLPAGTALAIRGVPLASPELATPGLAGLGPAAGAVPCPTEDDRPASGAVTRLAAPTQGAAASAAATALQSPATPEAAAAAVAGPGAAEAS